MPTIMVSGGFDPLHNGHTRMIAACAAMGDVIVALNTDKWLNRKKGYVVMPYYQREEIMMSLKGVIRVVPAENGINDHCLNAIQMWQPDVFANGGDRLPTNTPEIDYCMKNGIAVMFNAGGDKIASSSEIVKSQAM